MSYLNSSTEQELLLDTPDLQSLLWRVAGRIAIFLKVWSERRSPYVFPHRINVRLLRDNNRLGSLFLVRLTQAEIGERNELLTEQSQPFPHRSHDYHIRFAIENPHLRHADDQFTFDKLGQALAWLDLGDDLTDIEVVVRLGQRFDDQ